MEKLAAVMVAVAACALASPAAAQSVAGAFSKGRTHFVVTAGSGSAFDQSYLILGVGASYYLIDGLNVGLLVETWTGSNPSLYKVTPSIQYVFHQVPLKPYIGGFYRRTYIEGREDIDSAGARAGIHFQASPSAYLGVGAVYETYLNCSESVYRSCDSFYPEVIFTLAF